MSLLKIDVCYSNHSSFCGWALGWTLSDASMPLGIFDGLPKIFIDG